jgi:GT2 family glycosyltransferase
MVYSGADMSTGEYPKISVVLVSYDQRSDVVRILDALSRQTLRTDVFLVDNGPGDGVAEMVSERYEGVKVIEPGVNLGYAGGSNLGIREAISRGAEWVLLLNTDTEPDHDFLEKFWAAVEDNPGYGAYMPLILYGDRETIWAAKGCLDPIDMRPYHDLQGYPLSYAPDTVRSVGFVVGCAFMMPAEVAENTGGFDEGFFMYYEDADLSLRIENAGYKLAYVPGPQLAHYVPRTLGEKFKSADVIYYLKRNRLKMVWKYSKKRWAGLTRTFFQDLLLQAALIAKHQNVGGALAVVNAWVDFIKGKSGKRL